MFDSVSGTGGKGVLKQIPHRSQSHHDWRKYPVVRNVNP